MALSKKEIFWLKLVKDGVFSVSKSGVITNNRNGKEICKNSKYNKFTVLIDGVHTFTKPRVIWITFNGEIPPELRVVSKDGSKNFALNNLELINNVECNVKRLTEARLTKRTSEQMTDQDVINMRNAYRVKPFDLKPYQIKYGYKTVHSIRQALLGATYAHINVFAPPLEFLIKSQSLRAIERKVVADEAKIKVLRKKPVPSVKPKPKPAVVPPATQSVKMTPPPPSPPPEKAVETSETKMKIGDKVVGVKNYLAKFGISYGGKR